MKIEKIAMSDSSHGDEGEWKEFLVTLSKLKVGESFICKVKANHRTVISAMKIIANKAFITRKEKADLFRIGRIK